MKDIYFDKKYAELYKKAENATAEVFEFACEHGSVQNLFLKRKAPETDRENYEIISPYGYGGAIITELKGDKESLVNEYQKAFGEYCKKNNIVTEFVRFHPIINNAADFASVYSPIFSRKTLATNLEYENPFETEFSKSCRKTVRQALNKGVTFSITKAPDEIDEFKSIYYSTMDRNAAGEYYYFDDDYFADCIKNLKENVLFARAIYEGKTIAAGLYFSFGTTIHAHLSGTLTEYLHLSPAYILKYGTLLWGKENGYKLIHYGGGRSNYPEDILYTFKRKFAQNTEFDFYIAKKIWDQKAYDDICKKTGADPNGDFFPAWRAR